VRRPLTMTIRAYEPSDRAAIRSLLERTPLPDGTLPTAADWPAELDDIPLNFAAFWVAVDEANSVVGTVGVQDASSHPATIAIPDSLAQPVRTARLRRLDVAPEHQRQGLGRRLSQTALDWARDTGFARVVLDTTTLQLPAIALYESMGFRQAGQTRFRRWNILWFELVL
jgi:GNAT superfamily N-acetyltransferase